MHDAVPDGRDFIEPRRSVQSSQQRFDGPNMVRRVQWPLFDRGSVLVRNVNRGLRANAFDFAGRDSSQRFGGGEQCELDAGRTAVDDQDRIGHADDPIA